MTFKIGDTVRVLNATGWSAWVNVGDEYKITHEKGRWVDMPKGAISLSTVNLYPKDFEVVSTHCKYEEKIIICRTDEAFTAAQKELFKHGYKWLNAPQDVREYSPGKPKALYAHADKRITWAGLNYALERDTRCATSKWPFIECEVEEVVQQVVTFTEKDLVSVRGVLIPRAELQALLEGV